MRVPGGIRRGKIYRARRPHPAYYHGRRVHVAYYRKYIVRRPTPYGKATVWQKRYRAESFFRLTWAKWAQKEENHALNGTAMRHIVWNPQLMDR